MAKRKIVCGLILAFLVSSFACSIGSFQVYGATRGTSGTGSIVGTTGLRDLWEAYQQRSFYADGRFWVFYYNGTNGDHDHEIYTSSADGRVWNSPTAAVDEPIDSTHSFSIWFDGTFVYNFASCDWATVLMFERGVPYANGTIIWQAEQTIIGSPYNNEIHLGYYYPQGCVDSNGYPWVAYEMINSSSAVVLGSYAIKSSTNDGTWNTETNFPYKLSSITPVGAFGQGIYPLTNGKVLAIYVSSGYAFAQAWNGRNWLPEVQTTARLQGDQYGYFTWSAVSQGDYVHFVYTTANVNYGIGYVQYNYTSNSFSSESIVQQSYLEQWGYTQILLSLDPQTDNLYCIWINPSSYSSNDTAYHQIVFKKYANGVWDADPTVFVNTTSPISSPLSDSSFRYTYGGYLGVMYNVGITGSSTFNVTFAFLNVDQLPSPSPTPTLTPTAEPTSVLTLSPAYIIIIVIFAFSLIVLYLRRSKPTGGEQHLIESQSLREFY